MEGRKLLIYIAMSLDGYIAKSDDDISWLNAYMVEGEDYGYGEFIAGVDTVIVGRRTYDKVLSMGVDWPHTDKDCYIITRKPRPAEGNIRFFTGDVAELVNTLKAEKGKNIYCDGGAQIVHLLARRQLIDEFIVSIIPTLLGDGIRLFQPGFPGTDMKLLKSTEYPTGIVKLHYTKV